MAQQQQSSFARPSQPFLILNSFMDAPPRPLEPILNSVGISLAASGGSTLSDLSDLQSKIQPNQSSDTTHDAMMRNPRQQLDPITNWYTNIQQGPWDPIRSNASVSRPGGRSLGIHPNSTSFAGYRSQTLPSESDTTAPGQVPSDSGYGSLTRQSIADASLYGDCDQSGDTASISSHIAGIHFERPMISPEVWSHQASATNLAPVPNDAAKRLVCGFCKEKVKTKSELKKHNQKHTKPYHCDVPGCNRTEGFSTPNDVDRHRRSCHPDLGTRGKYFKCTIAGCRRKDKKWPRADNFRQHLKRIHRIEQVEDDIEKYVCEPEVASSGTDLAGLASMGQGLIPLSVNHNGMNPSPWSFPMQSIQQGSPTDSYMDHQMDFSQAAAPQQHEFIARSGGHVQNNLMQMSPMGLHTGAVMSRTGLKQAQAQRLQGLIASSDVTQEAEFEESSYFNEASISDDESERDDESVLHSVCEPELPTPEDKSEDSRSLAQPARRDCEEASVAGEEEENPSSPNVVTQDHDDTCSTTSSSSVSSSSEDVALTQATHGALKPPQSLESEAQMDLADVIKDQGKVFDLFKALKERGMLEGLLEKINYQGSKDRETPMPSTVTTPSHDASKISYVCSERDCNKSFPRQCELRKHEKRHAKPYGCTFPKCNKRFGSKNDWKRHENSQHYQLELWKCTEQSTFAGGGAPPTSCARVFNRREQFRSHLQHEHGIIDMAYVEQRLEDCLDGRNYEVRFWCGFCSRMVQVEERGLKAWLGRFNHIDSHFAGQRDISEWKNPDPGLQEVDVVVMSPGAQASYQTQVTVPAQAEGHAGGTRASKRGAEGGLKRGPSKKARQSVLWYCCGCDNQQLAEFSTACMTPSCGGHEQCDYCRMEILPSGSDERIV